MVLAVIVETIKLDYRLIVDQVIQNGEQGTILAGDSGMVVPSLRVGHGELVEERQEVDGEMCTASR